MSITIQAGTTRLPSTGLGPHTGASRGASTGASTGAASGSEAQRAYQQAAKDLRAAQLQLSKDVAANAGEDRLKADQLAVQLAQAALAAAAAAVAKEAREAQEQKQAPAPRTPEVQRGVDLYA